VSLLAGAFAVLAFAFAPGAQAFTGGAASAVSAESTETEAATVEATTTTAFNEAELSFTPLRFAGASWYGGKTMWGRSTACGQILRPTTIGVANKRLPCGTPVKFIWHGHSIVAPVIDRGPYVRGRAWDLTAAAAEALEFEGVGRIRYAIAIEYASRGL
jgi:rare lipoprotein A (peptidoglycan hydrolase)